MNELPEFVTKQQVLKAIATEPLGAMGEWMTYEDDEPAVDCKVCAVGAVVRSLGVADKYVCDLAGDAAFDETPKDEECFRLNPTAGGSVSNALEDAVIAVGVGTPLRALSHYYETMMAAGISIPDIRDELAKFVFKHFPDRVKLR